VRPLAPVEAALVFALAGAVLAVTVPVFIRNLNASRMTEALDGLEHISMRASTLADAVPQQNAYPASCALTPATVPRATLVTDPPNTWNHPTWRLLGFSIETPHAYSFQFDSQNGPAVSRFTVEAHGDLDGDGVVSTFRTGGSVQPGQAPRREALEVIREVE
jgi:hypothetical protein